MNLSSPMMKVLIGAGLTYLGIKHVSNPYAKAAAVTLGVTMVAKQTPVVQDWLA